jgi:tetratricopeptide (TPR) repeat protein
MAESSRRGRREEALDATLPVHRLAFAARLRELRTECGRPPYRTLSRLAHCGSGSLSEAAGGNRFPTWETARGYVTGCLRHAGRDDEIDLLLPQWRRAWDEADLRERAQRSMPAVAGPPPGPPPEPPAPSAVPARGRPPVVRPAAALLLVPALILTTMAGADATPKLPAPMTGLYNILVAPFSLSPAPAENGPAVALQHTLVRQYDDWARSEPAVQTRGPAGIEAAAPAGDGLREAALNRLAAQHRADIVLTGRQETAGDRWTIVIEILLTDRVFGETPEIVGRHEIQLDEPADVVRGNVEVTRRLAEDALRHLKAVVTFVRGLGAFALEDYRTAEREFRAAAGELVAGGSEVAQLMLGNTLGRAGRPAEAAAAFRAALAQAPGYARARVGLAEALRTGAGCDRDGAAGPALRQAIDNYETAIPARGDALLAMKARLGLGLAHQCLSIAAGENGWSEANAQFGAVLRTQAAVGLTEEAGRQALRLAAEARAGQALTAYLTAGRGDAVTMRGLSGAALAYEDAIALLDRIGVARPTVRDRKLVFLRNLHGVYEAMGATADLRAVEARIRGVETQR